MTCLPLFGMWNKDENDDKDENKDNCHSPPGQIKNNNPHVMDVIHIHWVPFYKLCTKLMSEHKSYDYVYQKYLWMP